jgi:Na+-translocating ferredoxin:NAD+ oxidoreductase RnfC subunit
VVIKGQLIADVPEGTLGAAVHASVNGMVASITDQEITIKVG